MQNNIGGNRIEQDAEADLLAVMLFADIWLLTKTQDPQYGKKSRQLAQAA